MPTLADIRAATDRIAAADTQLEELAAMVALSRLVDAALASLYGAALDEFPPAEVARAVGTTRQAMGKRARQRQRAGPGETGPLPQ